MPGKRAAATAESERTFYIARRRRAPWGRGKGGRRSQADRPPTCYLAVRHATQSARPLLHATQAVSTTYSELLTHSFMTSLQPPPPTNFTHSADHGLDAQIDITSPIHHTHTHTHTFNGPFSGTTEASRYQKGKTNLDFTEARDSECQWHQLGHMQVCTSLQTNNYASTPPLSFYRPDALPAAQPTASKHCSKAISPIHQWS